MRHALEGAIACAPGRLPLWLARRRSFFRRLALLRKYCQWFGEGGVSIRHGDPLNARAHVRTKTVAAPSVAGARGDDDPVVPVIAVGVFDEADAQIDLLTVEVHFPQQVAPVGGRVQQPGPRILG